MTLGKTKHVRFLCIGNTKQVLPLAPKSPGLMEFIYVGDQNTTELVKAYSSGMNARITKVEFWLLNEAKKGWIHLNGLHNEYWNGSWMTQGYAMKDDELNWCEFMAWWAPKQLKIELDYWTMDPELPAYTAMARCLP